MMVSRKGRVATHAPPAIPLASPEALRGRLQHLLQTDYAIDGYSRYMVVVEGSTDLRYLAHAATMVLAQEGEDLLRVPDAVAAAEGERILICTPGRPGEPHRGGTGQMERLARDLAPYLFTLEAFGGVLFVFDGDQEGSRASEQLTNNGHATLKLTSKAHPGACATKSLVIEDLLSLAIQSSFFATGHAWCQCVYEDGSLVRFLWHHNSKGSLCEYVRGHAALDDLVEMRALLHRCRQAFGFP